MNEALRHRLRSTDQEHVIAYLDALRPEERGSLEQQLEQLDLSLLAQLARDEVETPDWGDLARRALPPPAYRLDDPDPRWTPRQARERGEQELRNGHVAALLVAGGQGSRLGFEHPKGMFPIGAVSDHSLLQILVERVRATASRYETSIPLWIMTSPATLKTFI